MEYKAERYRSESFSTVQKVFLVGVMSVANITKPAPKDLLHYEKNDTSRRIATKRKNKHQDALTKTFFETRAPEASI